MEEKKILMKDKKALIKACKGTDLQAVKDLVEVGVRLDEKVKDECAYGMALQMQAWYFGLEDQIIREEDTSFDMEKHKTNQAKHLEIVKHLTPKVTNAIPEGETNTEKTYTDIAFSPYRMGGRGKAGMFDPIFRIMFEAGYNFKEDKQFYWYLGLCELPTVKQLIELCGPDDGASIYSAASHKNLPVLEYLLDMKIPANKPFVFSNSAEEYPLECVENYWPDNAPLIAHVTEAAKG